MLISLHISFNNLREYMNKSHYKYESVADDLRNSIQNHEYPTGVLPTEQELMEQFGVGKKTVYSALSLLVKEGTISRVKGKGTYVNGAGGTGLTMSHYVPVIMRHTGHIYSALSLYIRKYLEEKSLFAVPLDYLNTESEDDKTSSERFKNNLFLLLNSNIRGIIFDGTSYWQFPFFKDYTELPAVIINCYEGFEDLPCGAVLTDFQGGTQLATSHLLSNGLKRVVFLSFTSGVKLNRPKGRPITLAQKGYLETMRKHNLEDSQEIIHSFDHFEDTVRGVLARKSRPEGIVCFSDIEAVRVINIASEMGLNVPDDLQVTGFSNTPWCEECSVKLTSISIDENEMARIAVKLLTDENASQKIIKIKPKLIIRESTSGK